MDKVRGQLAEVFIGFHLPNERRQIARKLVLAVRISRIEGKYGSMFAVSVM